MSMRPQPTEPYKPGYVWAAFTARPLGMPIPPNFFGIAAFALLGAFISPGFFLLGAGLEFAYLSWLSSNQRFRNAVDAATPPGVDPADARYQAMLVQLPLAQRKRQSELEARARDVMRTLAGSTLMMNRADTLEQLVMLHLRLLMAHQSIARVVETARTESSSLASQEAQLARRLAGDDLEPELRRSLEQQQVVIDQRQAAHANAGRRLEHVESELARIDQQVALISEQTLLASDEQHLGASLDALAASYNEANNWLSSQRDLLGALDMNENQRLPQRVLRGSGSSNRSKQGEAS